MSKRARPQKGTWKPPRPRKEIAKAVTAAVVILGATAGIIYTWPTGSGSGTTPPTVTTSKPKKSTTTTRPASPTTGRVPATSVPSTSAAPTTTTRAGATP